jgi:hypothetical protein
MAPNNGLDPKDLKVLTPQELITTRWKNCNIETLKRVAQQYPLIMEHRYTHQTGTYRQLTARTSKGSFFGPFQIETDALFREVDIDMFEETHPEVAKSLRAERPVVPKKAVGKSEHRCTQVREIVSQKLKEAGDAQNQVSYRRLWQHDPDIKKIIKDRSYSWFVRCCAELRPKDKSLPGRKKRP